jgi:hypothetical protein
MADVSAWWPDRGDRRGQLLLITALAVGIVLVSIALLLNAAIFTENVATRETNVDGREAIAVRESVVADVGELIERENRRPSDSVSANVTDGIDAIAPLAARENVRHGTVVELQQQGTPREGDRLSWEPPDGWDGFIVERVVDNATVNRTDWDLLESAGDVRAFTVTVERSSLPTLSTPSASELENSAFGVQFNETDSSNTIQYVYEDGDDVVVAAVDDGTDIAGRCRIASAEEVTVDLTGDRLLTADEETSCFRGLWPAFSPEDILVVNGDEVDGTFALTVDGGSLPTDEEISVTDAVYAATVEMHYRSDDLSYQTTVEVAPGEPR